MSDHASSAPASTAGLVARDAAALGDVLKVRFFPLAVASAAGCSITDVEGQVYLDFTAGWAVANTGYGPQEIVDAVAEQMRVTSFATLTAFVNEPAVALAEELVGLMPGDFPKKAWFGLHGSDACDTLAKLVPLATGRPRMLSYIGAYHGQTGGSAAISGHTAQAMVASGGNVVKIPYPYCYRCMFGETSPDTCSLRCLEYVEQLVMRTICPPKSTAAVIIEAVQSDGGDVPAPERYLQALEGLCRKHGILLLLDEVKVGFGRTGKMFSFEHAGVVPDGVALGKSIGSGIAALSAVVARADILDVAPAINMYTIAGNPVSATAGLATLAYIREHDLVSNAAEIGGRLLDGFQAMSGSHPLIGDVRGKGMILGVELVRDRESKDPAAAEAAKLVYRCKELGLLIFYGGIYSNVIEVTPPLTLSVAEADRGLALFEEALSDVEAGRVPDEKLGDYAGW
jgi:4-aminobutyrate aminotransferase